MTTFPRTRLFAELLEDRSTPAALVESPMPEGIPAVGDDPNVLGSLLVAVGRQTGGEVWTTHADTPATLRPFGPGFTGSVSAAAADVTGDGFGDVVAGAGAGGSPRVVVLDRSGAELRSFLAFDAAFTGGVSVAAGDVNFDGYADVVAAVDGGGGPHVKVFDGKSGAEVRSFFAYDPAYTGGVRVAVADVNGDGRDDIVTSPAAAGGPNVKVFSGADGSLLRSFFAYAEGYTGGVNVAAADVDRDGFADIVTGSAAGSSHVKVFSGRTGAEADSFFAFAPDMPGGVRVAAGEFDGDLTADIAVSSAGAAAQARFLNGVTGEDLPNVKPGVRGFAGADSVGVGARPRTLNVPPSEQVPDDVA